MKIILAVLALLFAVNAARAESDAFKQAVAPCDWSFPRDHGRHDGFKTEWWYFTGNVRDASGRAFGYQLTFFRTAMRASPATRPSAWGMRDLYFAHAAISDVAGGGFAFKDRLARGRPGLAWASDEKMSVQLADWSLETAGDGELHLLAGDEGFKIDLTCGKGRGPVFEGPGGINAKGRERGQASYYYSMTRIPTSGTLTTGGKDFSVSGQSWMDHEFSSNALGADQIGWDWMGLQLASGDDLMIYRMRNRSGGDDYLSGTRITPDGQPHYLSAADLKLTGSEPWKSPRTGGVYPQSWQLWCRDIGALTVRSRFPGQELVTPNSTDVSYFEGTAVVTDEKGQPAGEGYLEMTGYAKALSAPGSQ